MNTRNFERPLRQCAKCGKVRTLVSREMQQASDSDAFRFAGTALYVECECGKRQTLDERDVEALRADLS